MTTENEETLLKCCLNKFIASIEKSRQEYQLYNERQNQELLQPQSDQSADSLLENSQMNVNIYSFSLNENETDALSYLTKSIETILNDYIDNFSEACIKHLLDILNRYHYNRRTKCFSSTLTVDSLYPLHRDFKGLLASIDAFTAAVQGNLILVKEFLENYPDWKDKPGLRKSTLLYSATSSNQFHIVKYLIEEAHCSVNALNQRDNDETTTLGTHQSSAAAETALHGACYNNYLPIVQYLVDHGANYFSRNQADKTPIMNGKQHDEIKQYFLNYLIIKYLAETPTNLPDEPFIEDKRRPMADRWWEYKPIQDSTWYKFPEHGAVKLHEALLPSERFQEQVHLSIRQDLFYCVTMTDFFRSGNYNQDPEKKVAWVRCRGSSIFNFDCYALWQIMILQHHEVSNKLDLTQCLTVEKLPEMTDSSFKLQLNIWYKCDTKLNKLLDDSMNLRRKITKTDIPFIGDKLNINLETFSIENDDKTIVGCIRWIPKLISNIERKRNRIVEINNYQPMANMEPIPFTTKHLKDAIEISDGRQPENFSLEDEDDQTGAEGIMVDDSDTEDEDDLHSDNEDNGNTGTTKNKNVDCKVPPELMLVMREMEGSTASDETSQENYFSENVGQFTQPPRVEKTNDLINTEVTDAILAKMLSESEKLQYQMQQKELEYTQHIHFQEQLNKDKDQLLTEAYKQIELLKMQAANAQSREKELKTTISLIKTVDYKNIDPFLIKHFLFGKTTDIEYYLSEKTKLDEILKGKIPTVGIREQQNFYVVQVTGLQVHHDEFKAVLMRIQVLSNVTQSAIGYYGRELRRTIRNMNQKLIAEIPWSANWICYIKSLQQLMKNKVTEYVKLFDDYIKEQAKKLTDQCIRKRNFKSSVIIQKITNEYLSNKPFDTEIKFLKYEALNEFINQKVIIESENSNKKPSSKSLRVMNEYIEKVKSNLKNNPVFDGIGAYHFKKIPHLLQQIMLFYRSCLLNLPLYEASKELLAKIEANNVVAVTTSTGSGKSSLLPALLIAEGYDRVLVTQPRRLPCTFICNRVNTTMTPNKKETKLAGWVVSGNEYNSKAQILYVTDGLLKERLLYDQYFVTNETPVNKSIVIFIDEVHERSINIDLCLALIVRLLKEKQQLRTKFKVIISSATLDPSVIDLFRQILDLKVDEYKVPFMGKLYPVTQNYHPKKNVIDVVKDLCKERTRHDQILCFVSNVSDVHQYCSLLQQLSHNTITAYPLYQAQSAREQQSYIENGMVFFATTIAETSLTFPSLKYVVDTGLINVPMHDIKHKRTSLKEVPAPESTIKQRLGRIGRTKPGVYIGLYDEKIKRDQYPKSQMCQVDLTNVEFSLLRSPMKKGLNYMKNFLPNPPNTQLIDSAIQELKRLRILSTQNDFTAEGRIMVKLPDFGTLAMSKAIYSSLTQNNCGGDMIILAAILGVLNTSSLLKSLSPQVKSPDGDFMTLLNFMNEVLSQRQSCCDSNINLSKLVQPSKCGSAQQFVKRALRRYDAWQTAMSRSKTYCVRANIQRNDWESIAKCLLVGYEDNVYVCMKELQGRTHRFVRYHSLQDEQAVLDHQSSLARPASLPPVPIIITRDIRYSSSVRALAVLSFNGRIKSQWLEKFIERNITLQAVDEVKLTNHSIIETARQTYTNVNMQSNNSVLTLKGPSGFVLDAERNIMHRLIESNKFRLTNEFLLDASDDYNRMKRNLESVTKMLRIFYPMQWRWENEGQVKITLNNMSIEKTCEMTIEGLASQSQSVRNELKSFQGWLKDAAVIRHPDAGVSPRILKPQMHKAHPDIEERISRVTDSKRSSVDLWNGLRGSQATRETRMEVVAWIAVWQFECRVEGGFVRDWIVGMHTNRPSGHPSSWISYSTNSDGIPIPILKKDLIPSDIDCHLPVHKYFDIDRFLDFLHKYRIKCTVVREDWRYILLLDDDVETGPFTMDLIEPHVALTQDRIDFDVSNLSLEKDYTKELGMRIDIRPKPYSIEIEMIVNNISKRLFQVLRPVDNRMKPRIQKMISRGWTKLAQEINVIPNPPPRCEVILVRLPHTSDLSRFLVQTMKTKIGSQVDVISIEQIKNPLLEDAYLAMKELIAKQCRNKFPNEEELFHGTKGPGIEGVLNDGFDDRYWGTNYSKGNWGHGAYFAKNPAVSHEYTAPDPTDGTRIMFYNKVVMGKKIILQELNQELNSAPKGYHSVIGQYPQYPDNDEYIVYRYAQALPYLKITYQS